jgi:hypothetical protein
VRLVRDLTDSQREVLEKAIVNTDSHGQVQTKEQPRIWHFYWNDDTPHKNKAQSRQSSRASTPDSKGKKIQKDSRPRKPKPLSRKRVLAYVWDSKTNTVFYAGSVYNPKAPPKAGRGGIGSVLARLLGDTLCIEDQPTVDFVRRIQKGFRRGNQLINYKPPAWNKSGERHTAYDRLKKEPVVFTTPAQTHSEVRRQIMKWAFTPGVGVHGRRDSSAVCR